MYGFCLCLRQARCGLCQAVLTFLKRFYGAPPYHVLLDSETCSKWSFVCASSPLHVIASCLLKPYSELVKRSHTDECSRQSSSSTHSTFFQWDCIPANTAAGKSMSANVFLQVYTRPFSCETMRCPWWCVSSVSRSTVCLQTTFQIRRFSLNDYDEGVIPFVASRNFNNSIECYLSIKNQQILMLVIV